MYLLGIVVLLISLALVITACGGYLPNFLDLMSLISFIGPLLAVLAATKGFDVFYRGMRAVIMSKEEISDEIRGRAASLFRLMSKTTAITAAIVTLICLVNILMGLDFTDTSLYVIGPNVAMSLLVTIYGLLLIVAVFEPAVFILKRRGAARH